MLCALLIFSVKNKWKGFTFFAKEKLHSSRSSLFQQKTLEHNTTNKILKVERTRQTAWEPKKQIHQWAPLISFLPPIYSRQGTIEASTHNCQSIQFSHSVMSDSLQPDGLQHTRLPCPSPSPRACSNSCPSTQWCHPTTSSSVLPFSPASSLSQHQVLFHWVSSLHQMAKVLELQLQHQFFQWIFRTDFL